VYFPVSTPPARGDHGVTPMPNSRAIGIRSPSTVRSAREYEIWMAATGAQPWKRASICASTTFQAGVSEKPMYRTFPLRTKSSSARIVSSMGVW